MFGKWFTRIGSGVLVGVLDAIRQALEGATFEEFGLFAGIAAAATAAIVTVLGTVGRKLG